MFYFFAGVFSLVLLIIVFGLGMMFGAALIASQEKIDE